MRDQHKSKQELVEEVVGLRKQVEDLKASALTRRRVEDGLRASEGLLSAALEALPVPVGCLDGEGHLLLANPALALLLGYSSRNDLMDLGPVLGLFADLGEEKRVLAELATQGGGRLRASCRIKLGGSLPVWLEAERLRLPEEAGERFVLRFEPEDAESWRPGGGQKH